MSAARHLSRLRWTSLATTAVLVACNSGEQSWPGRPPSGGGSSGGGSSGDEAPARDAPEVTEPPRPEPPLSARAVALRGNLGGSVLFGSPFRDAAALWSYRGLSASWQGSFEAGRAFGTYVYVGGRAGLAYTGATGPDPSANLGVYLADISAVFRVNGAVRTGSGVVRPSIQAEGGVGLGVSSVHGVTSVGFVPRGAITGAVLLGSRTVGFGPQLGFQWAPWAQPGIQGAWLNLGGVSLGLVLEVGW